MHGEIKKKVRLELLNACCLYYNFSMYLIFFLAKNAFNLNDDEDLKLYDTGGAEIPQNVFLKWVLKHKTIGPFEVKKTQKPVETTNQKPPEPKTDETTADDGNKAEDSAVVKVISFFLFFFLSWGGGCYENELIFCLFFKDN